LIEGIFKMAASRYVLEIPSKKRGARKGGVCLFDCVDRQNDTALTNRAPPSTA